MDQLEALAHWLVSLDEPNSEERKTVTLTTIIDRARAALAVANEHDHRWRDVEGFVPGTKQTCACGAYRYPTVEEEGGSRRELENVDFLLGEEGTDGQR